MADRSLWVGARDFIHTLVIIKRPCRASCCIGEMMNVKQCRPLQMYQKTKYSNGLLLERVGSRD